MSIIKQYKNDKSNEINKGIINERKESYIMVNDGKMVNDCTNNTNNDEGWHDMNCCEWVVRGDSVEFEWYNSSTAECEYVTVPLRFVGTADRRQDLKPPAGRP